MTTKPIELKLFGEAETRLDPKPHEGLLTCNPSVELFAIAAGPTSLQIWRSNGQVVAKVSQRGERETVQAIRWKTDGQFLAVGWSDGVVRLMGLESSKAVHQMAVCDPTQSKITCIGWARNNAGKRSNIRENPSIPAWKEVASRKFDPGDMRIAGDLPRDLTFLEIETALPKISPLPISGGSGRWDKAVVPGLQTLRSLIHENFLPALERIGIILSRLLGIARFHESTDEIGFTSAQITKVADIVSCLILIGHKMLLLVMEELDLFQSFSSWLRQEIDRLASSSSTDELTEQEATMEHGKILTYIQQYMPASPLQHYLSNIASGDADKDWQQAESGTSMLDMLDKQIKQHEAGQEHSGVFSQVEFLCKYLDSKANVVFEGIAEAEKRSVRFGQPVKIQLNGNIAKFDVRMSAAETPSVKRAMCIYSGQEPPYGKVLDLKFLYDDSLLVLWALQGQHLRIVRIPHKANDLGYQSYQPGVAVESHVLSDKDVTSVILNMVLPNDPGFVPVQMEVKEATVARGYIPPRVCLLGSDLQTYKVFALPDDPFTEARKNGEDDVTMQ
ncbi:putative anaphase-promoting complex component cut20 apc4 protein [Eutypa lata UCREL1]|uniref:Anaphase-promoting complex subunit 4 n=1 Tax=Eutypa lata (strain UCR-EL1) TaxID=1287681 RepID=M7SEI8_EUTLA|nr:putative anaphase-promoting complex component cut20 apc4 protein [Eutypa lata UCREL1]